MYAMLLINHLQKLLLTTGITCVLLRELILRSGIQMLSGILISCSTLPVDRLLRSSLVSLIILSSPYNSLNLSGRTLFSYCSSIMESQSRIYVIGFVGDNPLPQVGDTFSFISYLEGLMFSSCMQFRFPCFYRDSSFVSSEACWLGTIIFFSQQSISI